MGKINNKPVSRIQVFKYSLAIAGLLTIGIAAQPASARPQLGINADLGNRANWAFADAMKTSRPYWGTVNDLDIAAPCRCQWMATDRCSHYGVGR
jgi:hypothetical protein